ncbi:unnamed protein product [Closterium sp. NIES-54]
MQMASVDYSTASYVTHVVKGLLSSYNLMRQMMAMPGVHESLNENTLIPHIIKGKSIQEAERPMELLPQVKCIAPMKQSREHGHRMKFGGGGSVGGKSTKDADRSKSAQDNGRREVVDGGIAGSAATPTTSPSSVPTAMTATMMTPREAARSPMAVVDIETTNRAKRSQR